MIGKLGLPELLVILTYWCAIGVLIFGPSKPSSLGKSLGEAIRGLLGTNPSNGAATSLTLLVRDQIPVVQGISIGDTANVAVSNTTDFDIYPPESAHHATPV